MTIQTADTDEQIAACYPVMRELRPHLDADAFVGIVRGMHGDGYRLAFLSEGDRVVAVAGFRTKRTLFCDKFLYVDDLVTLSAERSKGYGKVLLEWLKDRARADTDFKVNLKNEVNIETLLRELAEFRGEAKARAAADGQLASPVPPHGRDGLPDE